MIDFLRKAVSYLLILFLSITKILILLMIDTKVAFAAPTYTDSLYIHNLRHSTGITFNSDGTKMYILASMSTNNSVNSSSTDKISEFTLSNAYDLSGISKDANGIADDYVTEGIRGKCGSGWKNSLVNPADLFWNGDGTQIVVVDSTSSSTSNNNNSVCSVGIESSTAYDIDDGMTDLVDAGDDPGFDLDDSGTDVSSANAESITGVTFNNDGSKIFVASPIDGKIYQFALSTDYDLGTASYGGANFSFDTSGVISNDAATAIRFSNDGKQMFVNDGTEDKIFQWSLSTAFDLSSTITLLGNFSIRDDYQNKAGDYNSNIPDHSSITGVLEGLEFNNDGSKFFVTTGHFSNNTGRQFVMEYALDCPYGIVECEPTLSSCSPTDGATGVGVDHDIVLTFSEAVDVESGNIVIKKSSDDSVVETIDVTGSSVTGTGTTEITVNVSTTFDIETSYYITIDSTAFDDSGSLSYAGINDATTCNFSTGQENPLLDKEVVGLIEAQVEMSHRIIKHTTKSVMHRIEWLRRHKDLDNLNNQNITFQFSDPMISTLSKVIPASTIQDTINENHHNDWFFWSEGQISVGKTGEEESTLARDIEANGIIIGIDNRTNQESMYGVAFGYGEDIVDVGSSGTGTDTKFYSLSLYGTLSRNNTNYLDGLLGISTLKSDLIRKKNSHTLTGERDGKQVFSSVNYSKVINKDDFNLNPLGRIDIGYTELGAYDETGKNALSYEKNKIITGITSIGLLLDSTKQINQGMTIKQMGRLEYSADFSPDSDATLSYVTDPATEYTLTVSNKARDNLRAGIGFDFSTDDGFSAIMNYERYETLGSTHTDTMYFALGWVTNRKTEYGITFNGTDNTTASFDHIKNIKGFDLNFNFDVHPFSEKINQQANLNLSKSF